MKYRNDVYHFSLPDFKTIEGIGFLEGEKSVIIYKVHTLKRQFLCLKKVVF